MTNHTVNTEPIGTSQINALGDVFQTGNLTNLIPDFSALTGILVFFLAVLIAAGVIFYAQYHAKQKKLFRYQLRWHKEYNGRLVEKGWSLAKEVRIAGGILCLYIKDRKEIIPMPRYLSGDYVYNMIELPSGRYKNFTIPAIQKIDPHDDKPVNIMEIDVDKVDLDYQNLVIRETEDMYKKKMGSLWEKYGQTISIVILVLMFGLSFYFLQSQMSEILGQVSEVSSAQSALLKEMVDMLENINIRTGSLE